MMPPQEVPVAAAGASPVWLAASSRVRQSAFLIFLALCILAMPLLLRIIAPVMGADWAVLASGSYAYDNYRHQADVAHAYQLVRRKGIPPERIITFFYDDVPFVKFNPFPGQLFNAASGGAPGNDVYHEFVADYTGTELTPALFLAVLTGNTTAPGVKRVLNSTSDDNVFIFFADHGAPGLVYFIFEPLYATDLAAAFEQMHRSRMYARMVVYIESCESGSMFDGGLLKPEWNIYGVTASSPAESSFGTFCPPEDHVNGKKMNTCLGDLFSVNWMEFIELAGPNDLSAANNVTLEAQYESTKNLTKSTVMQYGDVAFTSAPTIDFIGQPAASEPRTTSTHSGRVPTTTTTTSHPISSSNVNSRDIPLHLAYYRYVRSVPGSDEARQNHVLWQQQLDSRAAADRRFATLADMIVRRTTPLTLQQDERAAALGAELFGPPTAPIISGACIRSAVVALSTHGCPYDDYSLQYHAVIVNACRLYATEEAGARDLVALIAKVCGSSQIQEA